MRAMRAGAPGSAATAYHANQRRRVPDYDPLTISDEELKQLPPAERGAVYKARAQARAAGGGAAPAPRPAAAPAPDAATPAVSQAAAVAPPSEAAPATASAEASAAPAPAAPAAPGSYDPLTISDEDLKKLTPAERGAVYKARAQARAGGGAAPAPAAPGAAAARPAQPAAQPAAG